MYIVENDDTKEILEKALNIEVLKMEINEVSVTEDGCGIGSSGTYLSYVTYTYDFYIKYFNKLTNCEKELTFKDDGKDIYRDEEVIRLVTSQVNFDNLMFQLKEKEEVNKKVIKV